MSLNFANARVLVTGDTGFVGKWLTTWLPKLGAEVIGQSLPFDIGAPLTARVIADESPDLVVHLAAQALVADSLIDPIWTFQTNVMGTAHVLEGVRKIDAPCLVVTSDKCYAPSVNLHDETDRLGGDDPYSASKGCAELVAHSYRESYGLNVATARAGNIIGGGDWTARLVPEIIRALQNDESLQLRHPNAIRPCQHVLDATWGYLLLCDALMNGDDVDGAWNFGSDSETTVGELASEFGVQWYAIDGPLSIEAPVLRLDSAKAHARLGWTLQLDMPEMIEWTLEHYFSNRDLTDEQIDRYMERIL